MGQQPHAEDREGAADDRVRLVAAGTADELPGDDGGADDAAHHGKHQEPGLRGAGAVDHLEEGREVAGGSEERDSDDQADQRGDVEDAVPEQPQGDEGFGREALGDDEERRRGDGARRESQDDPRAPGVLGASPTGQQDQAGRGGGQEQHSEEVDPPSDGGLRQFQYDGDDGQREQAEGHVDVEAPPPGEVVREVAAQQGSRDRGETERGTDQPHEPAALPRRHDVRDDRLDADHEAAAPTPWTARKAISWSMVRARPASADPTTKTTMANWKTPLRPKRSPHLP